MMRLIFDVGRPGNRVEQIPRCHYDFVTVYNNTRFDFTIFKSNSNEIRNVIGNCPAYTLLTFPHDKLTDIVNIEWSGGMGITSDTLERCKIFFTEENLGLVAQFRPQQINPGNIPNNTILPATFPIVFNVAMVLANTEYSQVLPTGTRKFTVSMQENDAAFRVAFSPGFVAVPVRPFILIPLGASYEEQNILLFAQSLFVASSIANRNIQIICFR